MAIRIVERVFGIDASQDPVYDFSRGRRNHNGVQYGGYKNSHAVYGGNDGGFNSGMLARRRGYQEYQRDN